MKSLISASKRWAPLVLAAASALFAQGPPPPPGPPPGSGDYASVSGTISQLNYGREMEVTSFFVDRNALVTFPPHVAWALSSILKLGASVEVTGYRSATVSGLNGSSS